MAHNSHTRSLEQKRAEVLDEVAWFLEQGIHPLMIANVLGRSVEALEIMARRAGRTDLQPTLQRTLPAERDWRKRTAS